MSVSPGSIYAVVLNFQNAELTRACVERLEQSVLPRRCLHTLIVDNGSNDGSVERLRETLPNACVIGNSENLGFAGGNNAALKMILQRAQDHTDPDDTFVLLLNNDVLVEPDTVRTCLEVLEAEPDVGAVGPRLLLRDGGLDRACRRSFPTISNSFWKLTGLSRWFPKSPRFGSYNLTYLDEHQRAEIDSGTAAFMLVRLRAIQHAGLLDDAFFMYGEDLDWAYRIKAHGWRIVYEPRAVACHLKGTTARRQSYRMIYEFYRAMWLFYQKHYARRHFFLVNWLVAGGIVARGGLAMTLNYLRDDGEKRVA